MVLHVINKICSYLQEKFLQHMNLTNGKKGDSEKYKLWQHSIPALDAFGLYRMKNQLDF